MIASERASEKILALPAPVVQAQYAQCGGRNWNGSFTCKAPYTCKYQNEYYWQVSSVSTVLEGLWLSLTWIEVCVRIDSMRIYLEN